MRARLFIMYAREDERWRNELDVSLTALQGDGLLWVWHDQEIHPGDTWDEEIKYKLTESDIILVLVSRYLLASNYIREVELKLAIKRHDTGMARVVPVILRTCNWKETVLSKLQALPKSARPVEEWRFKERAIADIEQGIRLAVEDLKRLQSREKRVSANPL